MYDYMKLPVHELVTSDDYYCEFEAKLKDPNQRDNDGDTFLHIAAASMMSTSRNVQLLIARGVDVDSRNFSGHTPLHIAVCNRKRETVVALLEAGAPVNSMDLFGRMALHFSVYKGQSHRRIPVVINDCDMWIVERLLSHPKTCIDPMDDKGETPLVWAVKEQNSEAVRALLKKRADANILNKDNQTLLHVALSAPNPSYDILSILLTNGAGIYCEDISRKTPVDILVRSVRADDDKTLRFAKHVVRLIALRYHIRDCLRRKLQRILDLYNYFDKCVEEVRVMRKRIIHGKVTLHDFCLDCFQTRDGDPVQEIYKPVIKILLTGAFQIYYNLIAASLVASINGERLA